MTDMFEEPFMPRECPAEARNGTATPRSAVPICGGDPADCEAVTDPPLVGECILTTACLNSAGYGHINIGKGKVVRAHRLAYCQANGLQLSDIDGVVIRHRCDNPACVNPLHLLPGTHTDNMQDMIKRGRNRQLKGEDHPRAKLTNADIPVIRRMSLGGMDNGQIAKAYGVDRSGICRIVNGKRWRNVK